MRRVRRPRPHAQVQRVRSRAASRAASQLKPSIAEFLRRRPENSYGPFLRLFMRSRTCARTWQAPCEGEQRKTAARDRYYDAGWILREVPRGDCALPGQGHVDDEDTAGRGDDIA